MSDFLLDFRAIDQRSKTGPQIAEALKFCPDTHVRVLSRDAFSLIFSSSENAGVWGPYECTDSKGGILVAFSGRVAFDEPQWLEAKKIEGDGGLAAKAIYRLYRSGGIQALGKLNGHFVVFIYDEAEQTALLVTDRFGMGLLYRTKGMAPPVFSTHPDVLALAVGASSDWDKTSLAEFLMTGRVSFPNTYYRNIEAMDTGSVFRFEVKREGVMARDSVRYFNGEFKLDSQIGETELAEQFAGAFRNSVRRRSLGVFGKIGLSLSGGLDSRAILSAIERREAVLAFTLFDEENAEFKTAQAIADACGVNLLPIKRDPEHYGNWAELGVRISGGMGCIRSNHYLGARRQLLDTGIETLLTGCYCDYLYKALALNTRESAILRREQLNGFNFEHYLPCYWPKTPERDNVHQRLRRLFPESEQTAIGERDWVEIERKRSFPLGYEGDSAMRLIPQRVMPWYLPVADNELMDVYLKIPSRFKLNASIFRKMLTFVCDAEVLRIPDNNIGCRVTAGTLTRACHRYSVALQNRWEKKFRKRIAVRGSWPNWEYYVHHSPAVAQSWSRENQSAGACLAEILGEDALSRPIQSYRGRQVELFTRIWTVKLWMDQRLKVN